MTEYIKKIAMLLIGLLLISVAVVVIIKVDLGLDPITTMADGIARSLNIAIGTGSQLLMGMMFIVVLMIDKKRIGIGTVLHGVLVGFFINGLSKLTFILPAFHYSNYIFLVLGNIMFGIGLALYIFAGLGEGTVDGFMMIIHKKFNISLGLVKIALDISLVVGGYLLGSQPGFGTLVCALMIGPIVEYTIKLLETLKKKSSLKILDDIDRVV